MRVLVATLAPSTAWIGLGLVLAAGGCGRHGRPPSPHPGGGAALDAPVAGEPGDAGPTDDGPAGVLDMAMEPFPDQGRPEAPRRCRSNADCTPFQEGCFIQAPISGCTNAPEGICLQLFGSNCVMRGPCACFLVATHEQITCEAFPGTACNHPPGGGDCYGCFPSDAGPPAQPAVRERPR